MPGKKLLTQNPAKNRQKTGTDAKVTECSSARCWQKWQKRLKVPVLAAEPRHFWPGKLIFILCLSHFRGTAGSKIKIILMSLLPSLVQVACGRALKSYLKANAGYALLCLFAPVSHTLGNIYPSLPADFFGPMYSAYPGTSSFEGGACVAHSQPLFTTEVKAMWQPWLGLEQGVRAMVPFTFWEIDISN